MAELGEHFACERVGDALCSNDSVQVAAHLGLDSCRRLPKRAIQFGSRIAQNCARHTHGSHRRGSGSDPACAIGSWWFRTTTGDHPEFWQMKGDED